MFIFHHFYVITRSFISYLRTWIYLQEKGAGGCHEVEEATSGDYRCSTSEEQV